MRMISLGRFACVFALLLASQQFVMAQVSSARHLAPANAEADVEFRRISSVRELSDGRTIALDILDDVLFLIDWTAQSATRLSRKGRGPGEFLDVGRIVALDGDTSVVEDPNVRRWYRMEGTAVRGPINDSVRYATDVAFNGVDRTGRYLESHPFKFGRSEFTRTPRIRAFAESLVVIAFAERGARRDTVARVAGSFMGHGEATKTAGGHTMRYSFYARFAAEEQAFLFPDGWIALALRGPYRVDWIAPDGRRIAGPPLPYERVPVDERQKQAAMDRHWTGALRGAFSSSEMPGWPAHLPPFQPNALIPAPDGSLLIERTLDATKDGRFYDRVDRSGRLIERLVTGIHERIVGFGRGTVFTVLQNEDELELLRRHAFP
jgi:hypothetical protein